VDSKEKRWKIPIRSNIALYVDVYIYICVTERWRGERAGAESRSRRNASVKQESCVQQRKRIVRHEKRYEDV